jgi:hypothetical protein
MKSCYLLAVSCLATLLCFVAADVATSATSSSFNKQYNKNEKIIAAKLFEYKDEQNFIEQSGESVEDEQSLEMLSSDAQFFFDKHVKQILKEGPKNRFFNYFSPSKTQAKFKQSINNININTNDRNDPMFNPFNLRSTSNSRVLDALSTIGIEMSRELLSSNSNLTVKQLKQIRVPADSCPFKRSISCDPNNKFQSIDGSCNNLASPWFGKAETPYKRYTAPAYLDGLDIPRTMAKNGSPLPNVRRISLLLCRENFQFDNHFTHMTAYFGQFLTHDISMASVSTGSIILFRF